MEKRWCILTDRLPTELVGKGESFPLDTRTSTALNCLRKLREDIPPELKVGYIFKRLGLPEADLFSEIMDYLAGPPSDDARESKGPPSFDYFQDSELILAAFQQAYGLDLNAVTNLHWWHFLSLLGGLPSDTRFMEVVNIRTMEIDPKESAESKAKKLKAKKAVALKDTRTEAEKQRDVQRQLNNLGL